MRGIRGITLVALVITIIVLLILAGIAINLTIGNNGLFTRAENAANEWRKAEANEADEMQSFINTYDETLNNLGLDGSGNSGGESKTPITQITGNETTNTETEDKIGNRVVVPAGFKVVNPEATVNEGIVIEDVSGNNSDTVGNQFVWIPCEIETEENKNNGKLKYDRYAFTRDGWTYRQIKLSEQALDGSYKIQRVDQPLYYFNEAIPNEERTSIEKYGGYYIGRYEVGCDIERTSSSKGNISQLAKIQSGLNVYNYITSDEAVTIAERMYGERSRLCSSYAWDTALKYMDGELGTYAVNSVEGNYSGKLESTGYHAVRNIYDMGGNIWEWTSENYTYSKTFGVLRGGYWDGNNLSDPASHRSYYSNTGSAAIDFYGLRCTLYM